MTKKLLSKAIARTFVVTALAATFIFTGCPVDRESLVGTNLMTAELILASSMQWEGPGAGGEFAIEQVEPGRFKVTAKIWTAPAGYGQPPSPLVRFNMWAGIPETHYFVGAYRYTLDFAFDASGPVPTRIGSLLLQNKTWLEGGTVTRNVSGSNVSIDQSFAAGNFHWLEVMLVFPANTDGEEVVFYISNVAVYAQGINP